MKEKKIKRYLNFSLKKTKVVLLYLSFLFVCYGLPSLVYAGLADSYGFSAFSIGKGGEFSASTYGWAASFGNMGGVSVENDSKRRRIQNRQHDKKKKNTKKGDVTSKSGCQCETSSALHNQINEIGLAYIYQRTSGKINPNTSNIQNKETLDQIQRNVVLAEDSLNYGIIQMGLSLDLRPIVSTPYDTPVKLGLALTVRDNGALASINDVNPDSYNFIRYGKEAETITVITGISFQVWKKRLSIGIGGNLGLTGNASFNITDVDFVVNEFQLPGHEFRADVRPDFSLVTGFVYIQPIVDNHELRFGGSYKQETEVSLGPVSGEARVRLLDIPIGLTFSLLDFYVPNIYSLGLSYKVNFKGYDIIVSYDQEYQEWSRASSSDSKILFFNNKGVTLPGLKDILISKASIEYHPISWPLEIRGGYSYRPSIAPPAQTSTTNFLDNARHIMALGFSLLFDSNFILKKRSQLNIGVQYQKSNLASFTKNRDDVLITELQPDYTYSSDVLIFGADFVVSF